jgi:hypothetical protein
MKVSEMAQILNAIKSMREKELNVVINAVNEARRRVSKQSLKQRVKHGVFLTHL